MKKIISKIDFYQILIPITIALFAIPTFLKKDFGGDFMAYFIPHYSFILQNLKNGSIPFWFPYSYLGLPELFKSELALFHPITLTIFIFDYIFNQKNSLNILGNIVEISWLTFLAIGGLGFYRLAANKLNFDNLASFLGTLIFCLNPLMLSTMNTSVYLGICILPWIFLFLLDFLNETKFNNFLKLILINYVLFTTGYPYFYVYFFLAELFLVLVYSHKKLLLYFLSCLISFLLGSFFLLPNSYIYSQSYRDAGADEEFQLFTSNIPTRIVNIANPMPYGSSYSALDTAGIFTSNGVSWGIFSLVFLILGFLTFKKSKFNLWLFGTFVIALFYSFGGYLGSNQFFGTIIPFVNKFRSHSISLVLTLFAGCLFIVQGINSSINGERKKTVEYTFWVLTLIAFAGLSLIPLINPEFANTNLKQVLSVARFVFIMGTSLGILYLTVKYKTKSFLYIGTVILLLEFYFYFINLNGHFSETTYGKQYETNSLIPSDSSGKLHRVYFDNNQFAYNSSLSKTFSFGGYETSTYKGWYSIQGEYGFIKTLKLANVKYFITTNPTWENSNPSIKLIKDTGPFEKPGETFISNVPGLPFNSPKSQNTHYIYEILDAQERFFAPKIVKFCQKEKCEQKGNLPDFAVVRGNFETISNPNNSEIKIDVVSYKPSIIKIKVSSPDKAFIVASETWDLGWNLYINKEKSEIYKVDEIFRGFIIPKGESELVFTYYPPYLNYGIIGTIIGILLLIAAYFKFNFLMNLIK